MAEEIWKEGSQEFVKQVESNIHSHSGADQAKITLTQIINRLINLSNLSATSPVTYNSTTGAIGFTLGTSNQLLGMNNAGGATEYKTLSGTSNQVVVTHGVGTITLSTPQNIHTAATPTFAGLKITEGSNAYMGVATLSGGTIVVSTNKVAADSRIFLTIQSLGTVAAPKAIGVTARVAATSFTITSADPTDTSLVAWQIITPA